MVRLTDQQVVDRAAYLVSKEGGIRATSRRFPSLKKSTLSNVLNKKTISPKTRASINRIFRSVADEDARERERQGKRVGTGLVDYETARKHYASLIRQGFSPDQIRVTGRYQAFGEIAGVPGASKNKLHSSETLTETVAKGRTVDEVKERLETAFTADASRYSGLSLTQTEALYRVYVREVV